MTQQSSIQQNQISSSLQFYRIENQNYLLHQQIEDIKTKYNNLKKEHQIWQQINNNALQSNTQQNTRQRQQLIYLKQQFVHIVKQKQQHEHTIKQLKQKIDDLKYNILQLKQLNQKQQKIHQKQIQFLEMKIQSVNHDKQKDIYFEQRVQNNFLNQNATQIKQMTKMNVIVKQLERKLQQSNLKAQFIQEELQKQKQSNGKLNKKLEKCGQIAKQMEEYYNNELEAKEQIIQQLEAELHQYSMIQSSKHQLTNLNSNISRRLTSQQSSLKCSSVISEYQNQQQARFRQDDSYHLIIEQRYEQALQEMKENYEKQIIKYQQKVGYLILKVEALEAEKKYWQNNRINSINNHEQSMAQFPSLENCFNNNIHHRVQTSVNLKLSKASNSQSVANFTPKSQFSHSIRQSSQILRMGNNDPCSSFLNESKRKKINQIKTPNKSLSKYTNSNRNSCYYQKAPLNQSNCGL